MVFCDKKNVQEKNSATPFFDYIFLIPYFGFFNSLIYNILFVTFSNYNNLLPRVSGLFENMVVITIQSTFYLEIHQNDFFLFFKNYF